MAGDALWGSTALLLHMDGANGSTTFTDQKGKTVSRSGSNMNISTAQSVFGGASAYFNGSNDYLSIPHSSSLSLLTAQDMTIEGWLYPTAQNRVRVIAHKSGGSGSGLPNYLLYLNASNTISLESYNAPSSTNLVSLSAGSIVVPMNQWTHFALAKSGTTLYLLVGGVLDKTGTVTGNPTDPLAQQMRIGWDATGGWAFAGYMDDFRVTDACRYTTNFTPAGPFPNNMVQCGGMVRDSTGAFAARTVNLYRRDTGALVASTTSNATTGVWGPLDAANAGEHFAVAYSNSAAENDLIYSHLIPE